MLQQEADEAGGSSSSLGPTTRGRSAAAADALARAVRSGFLAQQLPDLALAVRRMQTGGLMIGVEGRWQWVGREVCSVGGC